jgi:hypothetical protein
LDRYQYGVIVKTLVSENDDLPRQRAMACRPRNDRQGAEGRLIGSINQGRMARRGSGAGDSDTRFEQCVQDHLKQMKQGQ